MGIALVDADGNEKKFETDDKNLKLTEKDEDSADYASRSTDPVRMYLREMGAVSLLDREGR